MLVLGNKFKEFLLIKCAREYLEGTTASGKTTVGIFKWMCLVADSDKKYHIIAGADLGTVEKNVINSERGLLEQFNGLVEYNGNGSKNIKLPHIRYETNKGTKIIYVVGYDNKARWQKVLGGQVGCVFVDEVNIADMEFLREISHRCEYMLTTSNPDDPNLDVYKEFLNRSRPLKKYIRDYPKELLDQINETPVKGWVHWYFTFDDNASLTEEDKERKKNAVAPGTKMYKNKILGLRGKATGLVFNNFDRNRHVISKLQAKYIDWQEEKPKKPRKYIMFTAGLDTAYSSSSPDTIAMTFVGITDKNECILLDEKIYNNRDLDTPIAPSDTIENLVAFLERNRQEWGFARYVYIDSADAGTITEAKKYKRNNPCLYEFVGAYKKVQIIDRINLQVGWFHKDYFLVVEHCKNYIHELEVYSWQEDKDNTPEDRNDHLINSCQYAWIPHRMKIGIEEYVPKEVWVD